MAFAYSSGAVAQPAAETLQANPAAGDPAEGQPSDSGSGPIEEIVVTAQKRSSSVQETPLAVTALGGDELESRQITDIAALSQSVPNVNFGQTTGNARIAIRGVGFDNVTVGNEGRVAYHIDGVYVSRPAAALGTFFDVERVEVVRGPQGTLYGRNATAGAVNIITREPSVEPDGYVRLSAGNYGRIGVDAAYGLELTPGVAARVAIRTVDREGYGRNITTGVDVDDEHSRSIRAKLRFQPTNELSITLSGDYRTEDDHNYGFAYLGRGNPAVTPRGILLGGIVASNPRDTAVDSGPKNDREFYGFGAHMQLDLGSTELVSITSYRRSLFRIITDIDGTSARLSLYDQTEVSDQVSQEVRLQGNLGSVDWLVGGYYFTEDVEGSTAIGLDRKLFGRPDLFVQGIFNGGTIKTEAFAGFGQVGIGVTDELRVSVGARYSSETKRINEVTQLDLVRPYDVSNPVVPTRSNTDKENWNDFSPRIGLEYKPYEDLFLYATYARGFKSGGFNLGGLQPAFNPETLRDVEAGLKADMLNGKLRANFSAFLYDYEDLQVSQVRGVLITIENAARASVKGLEVELTALPVDRLRLELSGAYLDAKYDEFTTLDPARPALGLQDLTGNRLTQAPTYTVNGAVQYSWPTRLGELTFRGEGAWVDRVFFTPFNLNHVSQAAHSRFNGFLTLRSQDDRWTAQAFVRNIEDKRLISSAIVGTALFGSPIAGTLQPPRTFGVELGLKL